MFSEFVILFSSFLQKRGPSQNVRVLNRRMVCGAGGSRTLVRTRKPYAFYTLIPAFVFVQRQDLDHQSLPYPLKLHSPIEALTNYFRFNLRRLIFGFGTTSLERRLVPLPCKGIKLIIYCASIKQREHTHCCQLIFLQKRLRSLP